MYCVKTRLGHGANKNWGRLRLRIRALPGDSGYQSPGFWGACLLIPNIIGLYERGRSNKYGRTLIKPSLIGSDFHLSRFGLQAYFDLSFKFHFHARAS
jgi:hypothetical protein